MKSRRAFTVDGPDHLVRGRSAGDFYTPSPAAPDLNGLQAAVAGIMASIALTGASLPAKRTRDAESKPKAGDPPGKLLAMLPGGSGLSKHVEKLGPGRYVVDITREATSLFQVAEWSSDDQHSGAEVQDGGTYDVAGVLAGIRRTQSTMAGINRANADYWATEQAKNDRAMGAR